MTEEQITDFIKKKSDRTIGELIGCEDTSLYAHIPTSVLWLSVRSSHCLQNEKITTLEQLLSIRVSDLYQIENLGSKSIKELIQECKKYIEKNDKNKGTSLAALEMLFDDIRANFTQFTKREKCDLIETLLSYLPPDYPKRNQVDEALNYTTSGCPNIKIPDFLVEKKALPFAQAYSLETGFSYFENDLSLADTVQNVLEKLQYDWEYLANPEEWAEFIRWITNDYTKKLTSILLFGINQKTRHIIERLAEGLTLSDVGGEFSVTRQRIRQIKEKAFAKIHQKALSCEFLYWLYGYYDCATAIELSNVVNFVDEDNVSLFSYALRCGIFDIEGKWRYSERYDSIIYLFDGKDVEDDLVKKINTLPDTISREQMDDYLLSISYESKYPMDLIVKETEKQYTTYGKTYARKRTFTLRQKCAIVLRDYFPNGYHISSEDDFKSFCSHLKSDYNYDVSGLSQRNLSTIVYACGFLCEKGTYKHYDYLNINPKVKEEIIQYIEDQFSQKGRTVISYNELFAKLSNQLKDSPINNPFILHGVLTTLNIKYYVAKDYLLLDDTVSVDNDFVKFVMDKYPVSAKTVMEYFCIKSEQILYNIVQRCPNIIQRGKMLLYKH